MALGGYKTGSGRRISDILRDYAEDAMKPLATGLYREAQGIMAQSKPLVPVDTGSLRASGYVDEPVIEGTAAIGKQITVNFGYGGVASKINPKTGEPTGEYALYVHENLEAFHKVGIAKYLEVPFSAARSGMSERLADYVQGKLHGGMDDAEAPDIGAEDYLF